METKIIMVVDDDENLRLLYEEVLTDEGYSVMLAKNGKEALRKVEQKEPHLVILDIVMPEMDGMEAMLRILRKHRKTPVILNTAYTRYREDFMTWAADAYVMKSSDLSELKAKVKQLLAIALSGGRTILKRSPPFETTGRIGQAVARHGVSSTATH